MDIKKDEFLMFANFIRSNFGINLTEKKTTFIISRLGTTIEKHGFTNFLDYFKFITNDKSGEAIIEFLNKITTNHTYFYREEKHFEFFESDVLPYILEKEKNVRDMRIWSAGCSSGEEPYTLLMLLNELMNSDKGYWDTKILATDLSNYVLLKGKSGIYPLDSLKYLPPVWAKKYFKPLDESNMVIDKKIKADVLFRRFNLMEPFPFKSKFHLILCRNVMIYFNEETKNELINKFYDYLEPGGYLFIGHSETIDRSNSRFKYIRPAIYRKE
ncbi:MAG: chemotaxis protein CheR [Clostridiales bacterium]|nr:chemotaxis protein CheR [Clostridiales bacterium]